MATGAGQRRLGKLVRVAAVLGAIVGIAWVARRSFGIELDPQALRGFVEGLGAIGPLVFVGMGTFRSLLGIPSQLVLIVGGLAFGTALGTLYGGLGLSVSAVLIFLLSRWTGREAVERRIPPNLRPLFEGASGRMGATFIFVGTSYPVGFLTAYDALAGVTGMRFSSFALAVTLGSFVRAAVYSYFGSSLVEGDSTPLITAAALIAFVAILPLAFRPSRRWLLQMFSGYRSSGDLDES
ncbi:MAG: TVP38/TMEM64 family protein [Deltaproteobacteria bacterium]|nr:TVP38/TMEM64 family protein [Deltaproteobacteria bacterium]MBW2418304.1 TVP38/TMEM64 family protein [Deltaproteobacteria bacterium]